MIVVVVMVRLFAEPAAHVGALGRGIVEPAFEQRRDARSHVAGIEQLRRPD